MFPFSRRPEVREPSPEVAALLFGLPRAQAPDGLRTRVLAAHARATPPRSAFALAWEGSRSGVFAGVATAGLAVVLFSGAFPVSAPETPRSPMEASIGTPGAMAQEIADARVRIVDERFDFRTFSAVDAAGDRGP
jgi:hypothetical protein